MVEITTQYKTSEWVTLFDFIDAADDVSYHLPIIGTGGMIYNSDSDMADFPRQSLWLKGYPHNLKVIHIQVVPLFWSLVCHS
jgi:hypothetical protein